jgi:hypothetical protein
VESSHALNMPKSSRDEKLREQLLRLIMSRLDIGHALSAATFLLEECDWTKRHGIETMRRFKCYETTMVVAYGRPFAQSRGHTTPLRWSLLGHEFKLEPEEKALHARMMDFRNRLHAHSDGDFTRIVLEIWRTPLPDGRSFDYLAANGGETLNFEEHELSAIHIFLWKVRHHLDTAIQEHPAPRDGIPINIKDILGSGNAL